MRLLFTAGRTFLAFNQFGARHWRKFIIAGGLILGTLTLRACYEAGLYEAAVEANPPLSRRAAAVLKTENRALKKQAVVLTEKKDSVLRRARVHETRAAHAEHQIDSLTHLYEQVPAAVARATDDELYRYLTTYRPAPFPDTSQVR